MGHKKYPFQRVIYETASAGTNTLKDDRIESGYLYCYQRVAVLNKTNPFTRSRVIVSGAGLDFISSEQHNPNADVLYWDDVPLYVSEGNQLQAELTGCSASDELFMYVTGWLQRSLEVE